MYNRKKYIIYYVQSGGVMRKQKRSYKIKREQKEGGIERFGCK